MRHAEEGLAGSPAGRPRSIVVRHPQLAAVLTAEGLSATGDAVFWVGLLVWLLDRPHGTELIALAAVARLGPRVVFGAAEGVVADRHDRRRLLVGLDIARCGLMLLLAVVTSSGGSSGAVLAVVVVTYVLATPYRPALTAGIPLVVDERDATAANALDGAVRQVATFLGPLLGTAVLWLGGVSWAFALNAATFALSAILLANVSRLGGAPPAVGSHTEGRGVTSWWTSLREGIDAVTRQRGLPLMTWLVFVFSIARGFELVLLVLVAQDQLGLGAESVGVLSAAIGVGALVVVPIVGRVATVRRPAFVVVLSLILTSLPLALLGIVTRPVLACVALAVVGVGVVIFEVLSITLVQRLSSLDLLGRVFGIENMAVNGGKLAGCLLAPLLVTSFSLEAGLVAAALIVTVSAVLAIPGLLGVARSTLARARALEPVVQTLAKLSLFDGASEPSLERLAGNVHSVAVARGTDVVRQGDPADRFYVIRSGTFDVMRDGVHVATIAADDWFGEIGLLRHTPRTATVRATTDAELWEIPGADFVAAITESAFPSTALLEGMTVRLAELDEIDRTPKAGPRSG
jgi:predicted MFS family arabinose efflux permease